MREFSLFHSASLFVLTLSTQCVTLAQCPNRGTVGVEDVSNTQGKPYKAKEIRTIVTYGSDGAKRIMVTKERLFRDGKGRIRIERYYDGTSSPSEEIPADIHIDDNCGASVLLRPGLKTAKVQIMAPPSQISDRPYCEEVDLKNPPDPGPEGKFEYLGHKFINGFEVRGQRTSYYASVQAKLSGAPPIRVYEEWCSILLDTPMGNYILNDNTKREITTVISDVRQIEPDPGLFEIPKDYKVVSAEKTTSVTLMMDWSRGDAHYGPDFIQLREPCQIPAEKSCECVADFKVISSKANSAEFANYVASFEHAKVPVTYEVTYSPVGLFLGARLLRVGNWTRDKFHPNDGLLGVKITFHAASPGQVQRAKIDSPGECFPPNKR